jgi:NADH-quinone oxidoreductase subunit C
MSLNLSEALKTTVEKLNERFPESVLDVYQSSGDTFIQIDADSLIEISEFLKNELNYVVLSDLFGVDRYTSEERFEVVYNLISLRDRQRIFVKVRCEEEEPELESVTDIWRSANWKEREVYDMFGIVFINHPDLRRIYMPEDFEYFPLRKEFPLLGIPGSIELPSTTPDTD